MGVAQSILRVTPINTCQTSAGMRCQGETLYQHPLALAKDGGWERLVKMTTVLLI